MSSIHDNVRYIKERCAICGYIWDYANLNRETLSPIQDLYTIEVHHCPICSYCSEHITKATSQEETIAKSKEFISILAKENKKYAIVSHKEIQPYVAYAYMREKLSDYVVCAKAYLCAADVEKELSDAYKESLLYVASEKPMIDESYRKIETYKKSALSNLELYFKGNNDVQDVDVLSLYVYVLIINGRKEDAIKVLGRIIKLKLNTNQINLLKSLNKMLKE